MHTTCIHKCTCMYVYMCAHIPVPVCIYMCAHVFCVGACVLCVLCVYVCNKGHNSGTAR